MGTVYRDMELLMYLPHPERERERERETVGELMCNVGSNGGQVAVGFPPSTL